MLYIAPAAESIHKMRGLGLGDRGFLGCGSKLSTNLGPGYLTLYTIKPWRCRTDPYAAYIVLSNAGHLKCQAYRTRGDPADQGSGVLPCIKLE